MSMGSNVYGVRDLDGKFAKMAKVKKACEEAAVEYPKEVREFFGKHGVHEPLEHLQKEMEQIDITSAVTRSSADSQDMFDVDLSKLPKDVKAIRFVNSY